MLTAGPSVAGALDGPAPAVSVSETVVEPAVYVVDEQGNLVQPDTQGVAPADDPADEAEGMYEAAGEYEEHEDDYEDGDEHEDGEYEEGEHEDHDEEHEDEDHEEEHEDEYEDD